MSDLARHPIPASHDAGIPRSLPRVRLWPDVLSIFEDFPGLRGSAATISTSNPSDDGPAYFTILLVGQFVVTPLLVFPFIWRSPVAVIVPAVLIPLAGLTLLVLPRVKGAVVGLLYAVKVHRGDAAIHTADRF